MSGLVWTEHPILRDPIALIAFEGWGDAGESASTAVASFLEHPSARRVASIDPDDHFDFQVRRPVVSIGPSGIRSIHWPRNELWVVDTPEQDLLVFLGEEPHYRWKAFASEIASGLSALGVRRAVTVGAFVGQVAHTLPVPLVGSATKSDSLERYDLRPSGYTGPTGILSVLGQVLDRNGIEVVSVWAAVPHYLSNQEYPPAIEALAVKASSLVRVPLDIGDLSTASRQFLSTVDAAVEENEELAEYIDQLEREATELDAEDAPELVEEIERFLRGK